MKGVIVLAVGMAVTCFCNNNQMFPEISGRLLSGTQITIPQKDVSQWVLIGFDQDSSTYMEAWVKELNMQDQKCLWFQVAMIGSVPPFIDNLIINGIKKSMPSELYAQFLPYLGKKKEQVRTTLGVKKNQTVLPVWVKINEMGEIEQVIQEEITSQNILQMKSWLSQ